MKKGGGTIRVRQRLEDATPPAHKEGATSQGMQVPLEAGKGKEMDSPPEAPGEQPC